MNPVGAITLFLVVIRALSQECQDIYSSNDCTMAANNQYYLNQSVCFMYSDVCAETCGCDYDPIDDRMEYGLDEEYYESDDFECVNGDEWQDFQHYNCTLYEGARWCVISDDGEVVEGPGWCDWLGPDKDKCNIAPSDKWPRLEYAANYEGRWAKSCCCNTGIADTYPYEESSPEFGGDCIDKLGDSGAEWNDSNSYSCRAYHFGNYCAMDGEPGSGWQDYFGSLRAYEYDGLNPIQACCACGGGNWLNRASDYTPSPIVFTTPAPTSSTATVKMFF